MEPREQTMSNAAARTARALIAVVAMTIATSFGAPAGADPGPSVGPDGEVTAEQDATAAPNPEGAPATPEAEPDAAPADPPVLPAADVPVETPAPGVAAAAEAAPGNAGTVKIHRVGTADDDRRNEPQVCEFRIVGFGFPADAELDITIEGHGGPNAGPDTFSTTVASAALSDDGDWAIAGPALADGMYKLFVENTTAPGGAKQKVFHVECGAPPEEPAFGSLVVAKVVDGTGTAPVLGFEFAVQCDEGDIDTTVLVGAGQQVVVSDAVPVGATCTVEETVHHDADATAIDVTPTAAELSRDGRAVTISITEAASVTVTFTNTFDLAPAVIPPAPVPEVAAAAASPAAVSPAAVTAVAGAQLARTGTEPWQRSLVGFGFVLMGLGTLLGRPRTA
jgi:hypothetical protein